MDNADSPYNRSRMRKALCWIILIVCVASCSRQPPGPIPSPAASGELVVLVRASATEFGTTEPAGMVGFEVDLVRAFAESMNLKVRFQRVSDYDETAQLLGTVQAHMAIGTLTTDWPAKVRVSIPIRKLRYVLAQHEGRKPAAGESPLASRTIAVIPESPAAAVAQRLTRDTPSITVLTASRVWDDMQLLRQVAVGKLDTVLTDDLHYQLAARFYPNLQKFRELPEPTQLVWAFPPGPANDFLPEADAFIERARSNGLIARLLDRYVSHDHSANEEDIAVFIERMTRLLPAFREDFFAAERETGVDWRLLAAIAYQESHWDSLATSPTGVRGIMMLTEETADRLKVRDRLDPRQSIRGGARYFASLRDNLPDEIAEPDRSWLALASYNIGPGHMNGVLTIAKSMSRDTRSWVEMKRVLPLMERAEYAARLKSGPARGGEAVAMAENVRTYFAILKYFQKPYASFIGPRDRGLLAEQPELPRLNAQAEAKKKQPRPSASDTLETPTTPKTLLPGGLDDLDPEAATLVRERMNRAASGTAQ